MVIIIGAGLSGLVTAYRLIKAGIPFKILEAKERIGGRIVTKFAKKETPIEMGATWFGPQHQNLIKLINELELEVFHQFQGEYYFYDDVNSTHHGKYKLPQQEASYRIIGGSSSIIAKLYDRLDEQDVLTNSVVKEILSNKEELIVRLTNGQIYVANQIVLALPPKIWAHRIRFNLALPENLIQIAQKTQTWMEDSIKGALEFEKPFWKEKYLPATIMSANSPFIECYDHGN
jgi:monoamine oxidase